MTDEGGPAGAQEWQDWSEIVAADIVDPAFRVAVDGSVVRRSANGSINSSRARNSGSSRRLDQEILQGLSSSMIATSCWPLADAVTLRQPSMPQRRNFGQPLACQGRSTMREAQQSMSTAPGKLVRGYSLLSASRPGVVSRASPHEGESFADPDRGLRPRPLDSH